MAQGGCLCGTVRYEVQPPFAWTSHCHCSMCRKTHGTLHGTVAAIAHDKFRWLRGEDAITHYRSSEKFERPFCKHCGSTLPDTISDLVIIPVGTLDDHTDVAPRVHIFVAHKSPLYEFNDSLRQFAEYPPGYGEPVNTVVASKEESTTALHGNCLCGDVEFAIDVTPRRVVHCHCSRCRRSRAAVHGTNTFVPKDKLRWLKGEQQVKTYRVAAARMFATSFCERCGSLMPSLFAPINTYLVPVGSLNKSFEPISQTHIFTADKASWFNVPESAAQYPQMPPAEKFSEVFF